MLPRVGVWLILLAAAGHACAPLPIALPTGPGVPSADFASAFQEATATCRDVRTFTAELALSGRAGRQRLRGRVLAGLGPGALRLEGVAPFGAPVFVFVARDGEGTLLLPRDRRVLASAPPADILRALAGVSLNPDDLRLLLAGCVRAAPVPMAGRSYGADRIVVDLEGGGSAYVRRQSGGWRIVSGTHAGITVEYGRYAGAMPQSVRVRSATETAAGRIETDLSMALRQIEINAPLGPETFLISVTDNVSPLTLRELEEQGPLGVRQ